MYIYTHIHITHILAILHVVFVLPSPVQDDMVIEDMYIPGRSAHYLYKGYKIVKETVEGRCV